MNFDYFLLLVNLNFTKKLAELNREKFKNYGKNKIDSNNNVYTIPMRFSSIRIPRIGSQLLDEKTPMDVNYSNETQENIEEEDIKSSSTITDSVKSTRLFSKICKSISVHDSLITSLFYQKI